MEEAWDGLTPPPSQNPNRNPTTNHGLILQDFLNPNPTGKGQPPNRVSGAADQASPATTTTRATNISNRPRRLLCTSAVPYSSSFLKDLNYSPFDHAMASASSPCTSSLLNPFSVKQSSEENDCPLGDRRFNRMMKNRESAARSRSRRMAYIFELERKKTHLREENASLRKQLQEHQLLSAAAAAAEEAPKKRNLWRSFSALF